MTTIIQFKLEMNKLLFDSIKNEDLEKAQFSIENGADINYKNEEDDTVLDLAHNYTIINFLVENGANISTFNILKSLTAYQGEYLVENDNNDPRILPLFLKHQQDLDLTFVLDSFLVYHPANFTMIRVYQTVESLVRHGAVVGDQILQQAFKKNYHYDIIMFLLRKKGGINKNIGYYTDNLELFKLLVSLGVNFNAQNQYMFKRALYKHNFTLLNYLIKNTGTNVNGDINSGDDDNYITLVFKDVKKGLKITVRGAGFNDNTTYTGDVKDIKKSLDLLFDNGYTFKQNDRSISHVAYIGDYTLFQYMLSKRAPITDDIPGLFIDSARGGNLDILKYFENLLVTDVVAINLAIESIEDGTVEILEYIVNKYMNRISSFSIYKAFENALNESNTGIVKFLLENLIRDVKKFKNENFSNDQANNNQDNNDDESDDGNSTPLETAIALVRDNDYEILKLVLKHNAIYTHSSLAEAVRYNDLYIVKLLFFYYPNEIDLSWENHNYLSSTIQKGKKELFKFLISKYPFKEQRKMLNFSWNHLKYEHNWYDYKFKNKINPVKEYLQNLLNTNQSGLHKIIPYELLLETQKYLG
jgi:hypothetical protein